MPDYSAPVLLSHDHALSLILRLTGADPSKADVVADVLRRHSPEILTLKQASARFGLCSKIIVGHHDAGRLPAVNVGRGRKQRRLMFYVSDIVNLLSPGFDTRPGHGPRPAGASNGEAAQSAPDASR